MEDVKWNAYGGFFVGAAWTVDKVNTIGMTSDCGSSGVI